MELRAIGLVATLGAALAACGGASASPDAGADAAPPADATVLPADAAVDGGVDGGAADGGVDGGVDGGPSDAGVDAFVPAPDGGSDAGPSCGPCEVPPGMDGECVADAYCLDGACVQDVEPDGVACGELVGGAPAGVCVMGTCRPRGCGDGYREPGPTATEPDAPAREGCDDGNLEAGDACSPSCEPTLTLVSGDPEGLWEPVIPQQVPVLAADGAGRLLAVWLETEGVPIAIRAQRFTPGGVPVGDVLTIEERGVVPTVAGLDAGGWVVGYYGDRRVLGDSSNDPLARLVAVDGTVGPERVLAADRTNRQEDVRLASLEGGFIAVWEEHMPATRGWTAVVARLFDAAGAPRTGDRVLSDPSENRRQYLSVASDGPAWLVAWSEAESPMLLEARIVARRGQGTAAVGEPFEVSGRRLAVDPWIVPAHPVGEAPNGTFLVGYREDRQAWVRALPPGDVSAAPPPVRISMEDERAGFPAVAPLPAPPGSDAAFVATYDAYPRATPLYASTPLGPEGALLRMELEAADGPPVLTPVRGGTWVTFAGWGGDFSGPALRLFFLAHP